jgi:hypothetical protein
MQSMISRRPRTSRDCAAATEMPTVAAISVSG